MVPGVLHLLVIAAAVAAVAVAAATATQVYVAAAAAASPSAAFTAFAASSTFDPSMHILYFLNLMHIRFICRISMDAKIPQIWIEVCQEPTKASSLAVLYQ